MDFLLNIEHMSEHPNHKGTFAHHFTHKSGPKEFTTHCRLLHSLFAQVYSHPQSQLCCKSRLRMAENVKILILFSIVMYALNHFKGMNTS